MWKVLFAILCVLCPYGNSMDSGEQCGSTVCDSQEKCVQTAKPPCNNTNCTMYPTCTSFFQETCSVDTCSSDEICIDVQEDCSRSPCPLITRCIYDQGHQSCDKKTCEDNEVCRDVANDSCYDHRCHKTPTCLSLERDACALVWCPSGTDCVNIEEPCSVTPCPIHPRCVDNGELVITCGNNVCKPNEICIEKIDEACEEQNCPSYKMCYKPDGISIRDGLCPRLAHKPAGPPCQQDDNCEEGLKCCNLDGAKAPMCTPPVPVGLKPGHCPRPNPFFFVSCQYNPLNNCMEDRDCPLNYKCCDNGCNSVCRVPILFI